MKIREYQEATDCKTIFPTADTINVLSALKEINKVQEGLNENLSGDLLAIDIIQALYHFGEITGEVTNDELLGNVLWVFVS